MALRNKQAPEQLKQGPEVRPGLDLFIEAFMALTTCRGFAFRIGPIPYTAILDYCREYGITGEQRGRVIRYLRSMDKFYLDELNKDVGNK